MGFIKRVAKLPTYLLSDKCYVTLNFIRNLHRVPNLKKPSTFNEKQQYLKLYDRNPRYKAMVDKLEMRRVVDEKIGKGYTVPILGVWNSFDEIDFSSLPDKFVLKCNHDSGSYVICTDKSKLDKSNAREKISRALKSDYYRQNREWVYKDIPPHVYAEAYLKDNESDCLWDYKFFCFNGEPKIMYMEQESSKDRTEAFFDMEKNFLDLEMDDPRPQTPPDLPDCFDTMKEMAATLSEGIPFLRVDFFYVKGRIYVGETTFYHQGGFGKVTPEEWNLRLGSWIRIPGIDG